MVAFFVVGAPLVRRVMLRLRGARLQGAGGTPFASLTPAPPSVSCVLAAQELVSAGPHPPARVRGWTRPPRAQQPDLLSGGFAHGIWRITGAEGRGWRRFGGVFVADREKNWQLATFQGVNRRRLGEKVAAGDVLGVFLSPSFKFCRGGAIMIVNILWITYKQLFINRDCYLR